MRRPQTSPPAAPPPAPPPVAPPQVEPKPLDAVTFLDRAGLGVHGPIFFSHGFTTVESLLVIRHEDLTRMSVKQADQMKLKHALESYRSTGQIAVVAEVPTSYAQDPSAPPLPGSAPPPPQPPAYAPQVPTSPALQGITAIADAGTAAATAPGAAAATGFATATTGWDLHAVPPYPQTWPAPGGAPAGGPTGEHWPPSYGMPEAAAATGTYLQQVPGTDSATAYQQQQVAAPYFDPAVRQDMVFQWVDTPQPARLPPQQYLAAPPVAAPGSYPLFDHAVARPGQWPSRDEAPHLQASPGPAQWPARDDASHLQAPPGWRPPVHSPTMQSPGASGGFSGAPGADLAGGWQPPSATGVPGGFASTEAAAGWQAPSATGRDLHVPPYPQTRPGLGGGGGGAAGDHRPPPYGMPEAPAGAYLHVPGADSAYSQQQVGGAYPLFDHAVARRGPGNRRGRARGGAGGGRQGGAAEGEGGGAGGAGGAGGRQPPPSRVSDAAAAELQAANGFENLGPEGLRSTLVSSLESLYTDRIRPMADYVKGRLKERSCPEVIIKNFVELYAEHPDLFIVQRPSAQDEEVTILLSSEPSWFKGWVDIDSPYDPYDEAMWQAFENFLDGEHTFAGGRYGMARELMQRKLPFLADRSLGEVCHIVQLAIQHRRLIVYHRKMLKPIQTVLQPCATTTAIGGVGGEVPGEEIKDMDDLCTVLFRMLLHHPQGLRLCRLKQMIKHEFSRKLSEMSFQCTKLIELFNTEPLAGTFVLDTENDGKSIYVRLGDQSNFSDHVKQLFSKAAAAEGPGVGYG